MSVAGYLGSKTGELRLAVGDIPGARAGDAVLEGGLSVEEAQGIADLRTRRVGETYESVADYDPVLRSHCRLDKAG